MKTISLHRRIFNLALSVSLVLASGTAALTAEKMDFETHTLLIDKLERVLQHGPSSGTSIAEVRLRLADLLAERARLHILRSEGKDTAGVRQDRKRALIHYRIALKDIDTARRAQLLMQMAHLHETLGEPKKAITLYRRVVNEGPRLHAKAAIGQALAGWGDIHFRKGEFGQALSKFQQALRMPATERRGYITYRVAWCNLNLGRLEAATQHLLAILRTPELLMTKNSSDENVDASFHEDVARDLVIFIARGPVTPEKVRLLIEHSPEQLRRENLLNLAKETERLGKKREAIYVWTMFLEDAPSSLEMIDGRVHLATLEWGLNRKAAAVEQLSAATAFWKKNGCKDADECQAIKSRMRKLVVDWNRLEKDRVSGQLLQAYLIYNRQFDDEYDMHFWAAQAARILKRYNEASELYRRSSLLAHKRLSISKKEDRQMRQMFEAALIAQIEMAESGGDLDIRETAYNHYLDLNPNGPKALEVRYQRARVYYDKNRHEKAAEEFHAVALSKMKGPADIRKKAADLSLDALVLAKKDARIESWALEFARTFPAARTEYLNIARRAVLKEVAAISNDSGSSESELKRAARRLSEVNLDGTTKDERALIFRNHLVLAVRTRDLNETDRAANRLLALKGIAPADQEFALEKKVWAAEMRLDFETAYRLTKKMNMPKVGEADRHLRLAYLAELAGRNPSQHYENVLRASRSKTKTELGAARLVRASRRPWNELKRQEPILRRNRDLFADLVLELYARTRDERKARQYLQSRSVSTTASGRIVTRALSLREIKSFDRKIAAHRMVTASDRLIQTSLSRRLTLLKQAEDHAQSAIRAGDSILQAITLTIAGRENKRLYDEIMKLPPPPRLKPAQKKQYAEALNRKAAPFQRKAEEINGTVNEFWTDSGVLNATLERFEKSVGDVASVLAGELKVLAAYAPARTRSKIETALKSTGNRPSTKEVYAARRALARDPFSIRQTKVLKEMESELGRDAMVAYLDARLVQLEGGTK